MNAFDDVPAMDPLPEAIKAALAGGIRAMLALTMRPTGELVLMVGTVAGTWRASLGAN